jgi:hypothetical protein
MEIEGRRYALSILPQLDTPAIQALSRENYNIYLFSDFGSGILKEISEILKDKILIR